MAHTIFRIALYCYEKTLNNTNEKQILLHYINNNINNNTYTHAKYFTSSKKLIDITFTLHHLSDALIQINLHLYYHYQMYLLYTSEQLRVESLVQAPNSDRLVVVLYNIKNKYNHINMAKTQYLNVNFIFCMAVYVNTV